MAYYLGRDIKVFLMVENTTYGLLAENDAGGSDRLYLSAADAVNTSNIANPMKTAAVGSTMAMSDLTGVDLSIGVVDEDITYVGQRSVLKAEIKKETTLTLTKKKSDHQWDVVFNGPCKSGNELVSGVLDHGARWGIVAHGTDGGLNDISNGLMAPKEHSYGGYCTFGYRIVIQLKDSTEYFGICNAQITAHSVTLNADRTTEETIEFSSNVTPIITDTATLAIARTADTAI